MSKIGLIIEREYLTRVKKKSFILLTLLMPLLFIAIIAAPLALSSLKSDKSKTIVVSDPHQLYLPRMESNAQYKIIALKGKTSDVRAKVAEGKEIYAFLDIRGDLSKDTSSVVLYSGKQAEMELKDFLTNQLRDLARMDKIASYHIDGLDKILQDANLKVTIQTVKWEKDGSEKKSSSEIAMIIGIIATMIIYIFIFAYGAMVMNGVIEEKTNRIVEVIISSVKPFDLMFGKIIGIALIGLTQVLLWVILLGGIIGIGTVVLKNTMESAQIQNISQEIIKGQSMGNSGLNAAQFQNPMENTGNQAQQVLDMLGNMNLGEILFWFVLFFLGGYMLYASLFAAFGSAVDNPEDAQQFILPLTMTVLFALYAGIYSAQNPDGPLAFWCSMIPFTSPIVMMVRIPFGVPLWQLLVSYSLLIITFLGIVKMAAKIYRTGILMYGKKVTYKELWKWLTYKS